MRKYTALAGALLCGLVVSGCGGGSGDSSGSSAGFTDTTPKPTSNLSVVKWGVPASEPASLDWIYNWDYGAGNLIQTNLCEGLMRQEPDGSTTPALATKVDEPNDTTYVYTIRSGVTFTDGKPMTAADVAFSLNRNITASPPSYWGLWYENVASIKATGQDQVTVKLKSPDSLFPSVMSTPAGYVGEQAYIEREGAKYGSPAGGVMCTGPYSLKSWVRGQSVTLERNDHYWDSSALAQKAQQIDFSFIPDSSAMNSALVSGELDGASGTDVTTLGTLEHSTAGTLYRNQGTEVVTMQMGDLTTGPLEDVRIRQALQNLIDYQGIVKGLLDGNGQPAKSPAPPSTFGYAKNVWQAGYDALPGGAQDLDKAKSLIAAAGAPSQPIVIAVSSDDQSIVDAATAIQASAKQVGLAVDVRKYPSSAFTNLFYDAKARAAVNILMNSITVDTPDPLELYAQLAPGSPYNYTGIDDKELARTLQQARATSDPTERAKLGVKAEKIFADKVYLLPVYSLNARVFLKKGVTGVPVTTLSQWYYPWAATVGGS